MLAALWMPGLAAAHAREEMPTLANAWTLSPWVLVPLGGWLVLYAIGLTRLWRQAGVGRGLDWAQVMSFAIGFVLLFSAAVWPLDAFGEWSLAAHMAQHMLLLALVPPLLLAGQPLAVLSHALPRGFRPTLGRVGRLPPAGLAFALVAATSAHSAVMWLWHLPAALAWALRSDLVHGLMHASFLIAGLWFWSVVWRRIRDPGTGAGAGVLALLAVMMQMGLLGALLTFAPQVLYPHYAARAPALGLDALADQQLAGLLMWVPACVPYLAGAVVLLARAFRRLDATMPPGRGQ